MNIHFKSFIGSIFVGLIMIFPAGAMTRHAIDKAVGEKIEMFKSEVTGGADLLKRSSAVLVFPSIIKGGIGFGAEYGEGALVDHDLPITSYYNLVSLSFGWQLGAQMKSMFFVFMTDESVATFKENRGWKLGVDGSVAVLTLGANKSLDTTQLLSPVVAIALDQKGLMYNLTLEGTKITRIDKYY